MSNAIYPTLPGLLPTAGFAPRFKTEVQSAVSGREVRAALMQYPLWDITLAYEFLRAVTAFPELDTLVGFFGARKGSWDSFLVTVPNDNAVIDMGFATGDGTTRVFQITRTRGANGFVFTEPVMNVNALTNIKAAGSVVSGALYSVSSTGVITFTTAPANGAALTWTGSYYFRCRFAQDQLDFAQFLANLYELKKVQMVGAPGNRV
jgi:uncharacterized protein (TIGR02217 family)